jgi:hypothetical protein
MTCQSAEVCTKCKFVACLRRHQTEPFILFRVLTGEKSKTCRRVVGVESVLLVAAAGRSGSGGLNMIDLTLSCLYFGSRSLAQVLGHNGGRPLRSRLRRGCFSAKRTH